MSFVSSAAAALLLTIAGYQNLVTIPALKAPRAATRTLLRAQSRGDVPVVFEDGKSSTIVTLELNADRPLLRCRVEIVKAGKAIDTIADAPVQDGTVEVALPAGFPPDRYEMLVRAPADGSEAGRFSFQLKRKE